MLTHTVSDVSTTICAQLGVGRLEVYTVLDLSQITASQIRTATYQIRKNGADGSQYDFAELSACLRSISWLVNRQRFLPVLGELSRDTAGELSVLVRVLLSIRCKEGIPFGFERCTAGSRNSVCVVDFLRNNKFSLGLEAEFGLEGDYIVGLES